MVEKPIAHSVEAGERVGAAFDAAGVVGCVGHIERYNPALTRCASGSQQGLLGEIYQITTSRQGPFPPRIADVGVVQDLATHDIDLTAVGRRRALRPSRRRPHTAAAGRHEDMVVATGRLANGVIVNHLVNWLSPMKERQSRSSPVSGARSSPTR